MGLKRGEVGSGILAETELLAARFLPCGQARAQLLPRVVLCWAEVSGAEAAPLGGDSGEQADGAAHDETGRGAPAAGGAPLMVARRAEILLQVIVRGGQVRHSVAMEQAWPVAARHFLEMGDGVG